MMALPKNIDIANSANENRVFVRLFEYFGENVSEHFSFVLHHFSPFYSNFTV